MATNVTQKYSPTLNVSVTVKEGRVSRVTTWTTGVPNSTQRHDTLPTGGVLLK